MVAQGNGKASKGDIAGHDSLRHLGCHRPIGHPVAAAVEGAFHLVVAYRHYKHIVRIWTCTPRLDCDCRTAEILSYRTYPRRPSGSTIDGSPGNYLPVLVQDPEINQ
uniref:Uncharacterized protein n=1 Tax=Oryza brachyantha TaxID=4533 RepID=J3N0Y6_ORYBR